METGVRSGYTSTSPAGERKKNTPKQWNIFRERTGDRSEKWRYTSTSPAGERSGVPCNEWILTPLSNKILRNNGIYSERELETGVRSGATRLHLQPGREVEFLVMNGYSLRCRTKYSRNNGIYSERENWRPGEKWRYTSTSPAGERSGVPCNEWLLTPLSKKILRNNGIYSERELETGVRSGATRLHLQPGREVEFRVMNGYSLRCRTKYSETMEYIPRENWRPE
ncbi:hypothetical protein J6590_068123 [Homalodisca vitripennis]|nr:hypothetical protein J6590_068123 [Homalodisca vitripennis]